MKDSSLGNKDDICAVCFSNEFLKEIEGENAVGIFRKVFSEVKNLEGKLFEV
jgi:hypothetical protein